MKPPKPTELEVLENWKLRQADDDRSCLQNSLAPYRRVESQLGQQFKKETGTWSSSHSMSVVA